MRAGVLALLLVGALLAGATAARAADPKAPAPPDTTIDDFLNGLSRDTDQYFGVTASPLDTTGLDSARAFARAHPGYYADAGQWKPSFEPHFRFNRVDGPVYGGGVSVGRARQLGQFSADLGYAAGPNDWLGGGSYRKTVRRHDALWSLDVWGGRQTGSLDRDRTTLGLASLRAFINGSDRFRYLRQDGADAEIGRETSTLKLTAGFRDELESSIPTSASWSLLGGKPIVFDNPPITEGRTHEFEFDAIWEVPRTPITAEVLHHTSSRGFGSDFEYRRWLFAGAADIGVGRIFSLVPQVGYGRLLLDAVPQAMFFLGGARSLPTVPYADIGGTGFALGRLDFYLVPDLFTMLHLPHPDVLQLRGAAYIASGAAWGADPYGGPPRKGDALPDDAAWNSEAGVAFLYQPGIPDPTGFIRLNLGLPLGRERPSLGVTVSYTRAFDMLRPFVH